jgi:hypothetical protein
MKELVEFMIKFLERFVIEFVQINDKACENGILRSEIENLSRRIEGYQYDINLKNEQNQQLSESLKKSTQQSVFRLSSLDQEASARNALAKIRYEVSEVFPILLLFLFNLLFIFYSILF